MTHQIVTMAEIERRARAAHAKGVPLSDCPYNWHSCAYDTWHAVYAQLESDAALARAQHQEQAA